ncbi:ABC transporter substrate-binding protein [Pseudomonas sp. MS19]|uniref:ABC transporter substrate-binding protein n=1 Tax=Pseudomonas sp. MS19 TaxID=2579939 RepID=UPI0015624666|nr:ABC transporter substrate-binding protein [Pseudomonas sp. MS19]NRH29860.1 ABC transporter substrate-binding protein [Pseudomonas sp. MS19]
MNTKNIVRTLGLMTLIVMGSNAYAENGTMRVGIEAAYPPFAYKTPDNKIQGFDYDIGEAICAEMKVKCEWVEVEFDGLIPSLKVRKIDAAISSVSITPDRLKSVDFTNSYYRLPAKIAVRKDSAIKAIPEDLAGKRIGVQRSTNFDRYATEHFQTAGAEIIRYGNQAEIFLDMLAGRLDATMAGSIAIEEGLLNKPDGETFGFVGPDYTDTKYFGMGAGIAVRKNNPLTQEINQALTTIRANGTYDSIRKKYFSYDIY